MVPDFAALPMGAFSLCAAETQNAQSPFCVHAEVQQLIATHHAPSIFCSQKLTLVPIWRGFRLVYGWCSPRACRLVWLQGNAREIG
jgi:hypothetical protein